MIHCSDGSLYTGITTDVEKRFNKHAMQQGAKYFRGRKPKRLVYLENGHDRSSASKREIEVKKLLRVEKIKLIASAVNQVEQTQEIVVSIVGDVSSD